ncbi:Ion transport peptide [Amphibalanus amphitrite]|uniref:Ion transport peptide n=1 Tax=Amphibalanus amphitrite TaxID=1232801 RepID=A0A6A4WFK8_AMPAM|nr:CHH-like protein [Amphibalanus amphitrite]KAF0300808.1 Ion transport peptide [Amphibalanus amphitrite]
MSSRRAGAPLLVMSALCVALWALLVCPPGAEALPPLGRQVGRPYTALEFQDLECGGRFDRSLVAQLTMVCRDCEKLYQHPEVFGLCRHKCFSSKYFGGCLESLQITEPEVVADMDEAVRILKG